MLGTELHFTNPRTFAFLFSELFIEESYRGCERAPETIIDCGSNIGMSILLFKSLWPDSRITGIEASPETFALLQKNVKGLRNVTVINKAVGDQHGVIPFYSGAADQGMWRTNALRGGVRETAVEAVPLSEFLLRGLSTF